jgi:transposase
VVNLEGVVMILELHRQGLSSSEIARRSGLDRKTVRRYVERGLEPPTYGPRKPRPTLLDPFTSYLRERVRTYPGLTGARLLRELRERGYTGARNRSNPSSLCQKILQCRLAIVFVLL